MAKYLKTKSIGLSLMILFQMLFSPFLVLHAEEIYENDQSNNGEIQNTIIEDNEPPSTPVNLYLLDLSDSSVSIYWDPAYDNNEVTGYLIFRDEQQLATVTNSVYFSDIALSPLTTYKYEVAAFDYANNVSEKSQPLWLTTGPQPGNGSGLLGEYYNDLDFKDFMFSRLDNEIDINWGSGSPDQSIDSKSYSVRWSGKIEPKYDEEYTFQTITHGGVRLWIDNQLLINDIDAHNMTKQISKIDLKSGELYSIKMEYRESNGVALAQLYWSSDQQKHEIVPQSQLYPSSVAVVPTNIHAVAKTTNITLIWDEVFGASNYDVEVDGQVINVGLNTTFFHSGLLPNSQHVYKVRANNDEIGEWSNPLIVSTLSEAGNGLGLKGEYFEGTDLIDLKTTRIDETINFDWKRDFPAPGINSHEFSIRWSGQVEPKYSESYTFYTEAHGGLRLWIDNQLLIDDWTAHNMSRQSGTIYLEAGKRYDIKLEYWEGNGIGLAKLFWESKSQVNEIIPKDQLYPLGIPQNITSMSGEKEISLSWTPVTFADGYEIEADGQIYKVFNTNSFIHSNLIPGTKHNYRIRALDGNIYGEWSNPLTEFTNIGTAIIHIEATEVSNYVSWEVVEGAISYDLEVDGTVIDLGNNNFFTHSNLESGTEHLYRVRAIGKDVVGEWTPIIISWTLPDVPNNIIITSTSTSVQLSWDSVRGATGYELEIYDSIVDLGNVTEYTEDGLNPNMQRTYKVRAINSSGPGKWSDVIVRSTLPGVPSNLNGMATENMILLSWNPVAGATSYDLEVDGILLENLTNAMYDHLDLQPNTTHSYKVRAKNQYGVSNWSSKIDIRTLLPIPSNVSAVEINNEIIVTWDLVDGATGYDVEVDGVIIDNKSSTSYVHKIVATNLEHSFRVRAKNSEVLSNWSDKVSKTTLLGIPTNLKASATSTEITVSWDVVVGATSYDLEVDGQVFNTGLNTEFVHVGLIPNSEHSYRVRAKNAGGDGSWSNLLIKSTIFAAPTNITVMTKDTSISLDWSNVDGASGYELFVDGELVDNGTITTFVHNNLEPSTWHVYRIRAKNDLVEGEWSDPITKSTLLGTPSNIKAVSLSNSIDLTWDLVKDATSYEIEVDGSVINNGPDSYFMHINLLPNSQHSYRVRAINAHNYSDWSHVVIHKTSSIAPQNLRATATTNSIHLTWDAVAGSIEYEIEIDGRELTKTTSTSYTHGALKPNTLHFYRVRAVGVDGISEWSSLIEKTTIPELTVNAGKDNFFNFVIVIPNKISSETRTVTVEYNGDELEALDLSALTPEIEISIGKIKGTKFSVAEFSPGKIVFEVENVDQTTVNSIKFLAKISGFTKITYTID